MPLFTPIAPSSKMGYKMEYEFEKVEIDDIEFRKEIGEK